MTLQLLRGFDKRYICIYFTVAPAHYYQITMYRPNCGYIASFLAWLPSDFHTVKSICIHVLKRSLSNDTAKRLSQYLWLLIYLYFYSSNSRFHKRYQLLREACNNFVNRFLRQAAPSHYSYQPCAVSHYACAVAFAKKSVTLMYFKTFKRCLAMTSWCVVNKKYAKFVHQIPCTGLENARHLKFWNDYFLMLCTDNAKCKSQRQSCQQPTVSNGFLKQGFGFSKPHHKNSSLDFLNSNGGMWQTHVILELFPIPIKALNLIH